jgi:hypothetical protein
MMCIERRRRRRMKRIGSLPVRSGSGLAGRCSWEKMKLLRYSFLLLVFWLGFVVRPSACYGTIADVQHLPANQNLLDDDEVLPEEPREVDAGVLLMRRDDDDDETLVSGCWRKSRMNAVSS